MTVCNLVRLRRTAVVHGVAWTCVELDPATVNGLVEVAFAAKEVLDRGWVDTDDLARLEQALSIFAFEDGEAMSEETT